jgi:hypothetical protein
MLLCMTLAGCAGTSGTTPPATTGPTRGTAPLLVLHDVEIGAAATSPGFVGPSPACDPASPEMCGIALGQPIIPTLPTPFNGTFFDHAHLYTAAFVNERAPTGIFVFTGSIDGCTGSGTATFPWVAEPDQGSPVVPNTNGQVVHGHDYLSAPTNTTGFARIAGADLDYDYDINPVTGAIARSMFTGTISCE